MSNAGPYDQGLNESFRTAFKGLLHAQREGGCRQGKLRDRHQGELPELTEVVWPHKRFYSELKIKAKGRAAYLAALCFCCDRQEGGSHGRENQKRKGRSVREHGAISSLHVLYHLRGIPAGPSGITIYYSFLSITAAAPEDHRTNFVGPEKLQHPHLATDLPKYFGNTRDPVGSSVCRPADHRISLLLAAWFTRPAKLKLKGQTFFKTVIYMPKPDHGFGLRHACSSRPVLG